MSFMVRRLEMIENMIVIQLIRHYTPTCDGEINLMYDQHRGFNVGQQLPQRVNAH